MSAASGLPIKVAEKVMQSLVQDVKGTMQVPTSQIVPLHELLRNLPHKIGVPLGPLNGLEHFIFFLVEPLSSSPHAMQYFQKYELFVYLWSQIFPRSMSDREKDLYESWNRLFFCYWSVNDVGCRCGMWNP